MTRRTRIRHFALGLAVVVVLAAVGCGGGGSKGAASGGASGAEVAPASASLFVSINTDLSSGQWTAVDKLLERFPGKDNLVTRLRASFESSSGVSWEKDVKPALGPEIDVVALDFTSGAFVALTQPKDEAKFKALLKRADAQDSSSTPTVVDKVGDWTAVSDKQSSIDALKNASGGKLASDDTFKTATSELDNETLTTVYVNGPKVTSILQQVVGAGGGTVNPGKLDWGAAQLVAHDDGMRFDGIFKGSGGSLLGQKSYKPKLLSSVPSGALLLLSFHGSSQALDQLNGAGAAGAPQLQQFMAIARELVPMLANENALYVRQASPFPEVTLLATPSNPQAGVAAIDRLISQLGAAAGGVTPQTIQVAGVTVKEANFGKFAIDYGVVDGKLIVTSSRKGIEDLKAGGSSVTGDAAFKEAKGAAGLPDETTGFTYVDLKDAIPVLESFAQLAGAAEPPDVHENLRALRSFVLYGTSDGTKSKFSAFLEIK
jgi:Protein of unknown function (DUF3352)